MCYLAFRALLCCWVQKLSTGRNHVRSRLILWMRKLRPRELVVEGASLFRSTTLATSWAQPFPARSISCAPWRAGRGTLACCLLHQGMVEFQSFLTCKMQMILPGLPTQQPCWGESFRTGLNNNPTSFTETKKLGPKPYGTVSGYPAYGLQGHE